MNFAEKLVISSVIAFELAGCAAPVETSTSDATGALRCSDFRRLYRSALMGFSDLRAGPKISDVTGDTYWKTNYRLPGAQDCRVLSKGLSGFEFICEWQYGSDRARMGRQYRELRDALTGCLKEAEVERYDERGLTTVSLYDTSAQTVVEFGVWADYEFLPVGVRLKVLSSK